MTKFSTIKLIVSAIFIVYLFLVNSALACGQDFKKVGGSSLNVWFWHVYDIELKTADGIYKPEQYPLELELTYKRDIDKDDLVKETQSQWERFDLDSETQDRWLATLSEIWPNVEENDQIRFTVCEDQKTQFFFNGQPIGEIADIEFGKFFSLIWLDSKGPFPKLTSQLIGQTKN